MQIVRVSVDTSETHEVRAATFAPTAVEFPQIPLLRPMMAESNWPISSQFPTQFRRFALINAFWTESKE
jgi:hypothetical protein